jgi:hypothetical protein
MRGVTTMFFVSGKILGGRRGRRRRIYDRLGGIA